MPVRKFRTFDDARRGLWLAPGDPKLTVRIRALWKRAARLAPSSIPRGVRKFHRIEQANQERETWIERRILLLRTQRAKRSTVVSG